MPFRSIIAEPEQLARLAAAFDAAWLAVNEIEPVDALAASGARERLAHIIAGLWQTDPTGPLIGPAVEIYLNAKTNFPGDNRKTTIGFAGKFRPPV